MDLERYSVWKEKSAARLKRLRDEAGVTQAEFAKQTDYSQQMVSRYESGRMPKAFYFLAMMERF